MLKFFVKIPEEDGKWWISFGHGMRKRNSASIIYNALEKKLLKYAKEDKIGMVVKDKDGIVNESIPSNNPKYAEK